MKRNIIRKEDKSCLFYGIFVLIAIFLFISIICYIRPPIGDDLLICVFKNGLAPYLDDPSFELSDQKVSTLAEAFGEAIIYYKLWSGRFLGVFINYLPMFLNNFTISLLSGLIISSIILCANILVYGTLKKALANPAAMILFFLSGYYFHNAIDVSIMWTIISQYQIVILLIMMYLIFFRKILFSNTAISMPKIILFNCLGLLTGLNQEVYVSSLCIFVAAVYLFEMLVFKNKINKLVFIHIGLISGTAISVFSPGNFNRLMQSHEMPIFDPWYIKVIAPIKTQILSLVGISPWNWLMPVLLLAGLLFIVYAFRKHKELGAMTKQPPRSMLFIFLLYLMLLFCYVLWIITYARHWHMVYFNLFFLIPLLSIIIYINRCFPKKYTLIIKLTGQKLLAVLFVLFLVISNVGWIASNYKTKTAWDKQIKYANENGLEEIVVPKFEEKYSNRFNCYNINNEIGDVSFVNYKYHKLYYNTNVLPK